jgi:hypothetical protein
LPGISSLNISPNPASEFVMVRAYNSRSQQMQILLSDLTGKNLLTESFVAQKGNIEKPIDVSKMNSGVYFLTMKTAEGSVTQKVLVK